MCNRAWAYGSRLALATVVLSLLWPLNSGYAHLTLYATPVCTLYMTSQPYKPHMCSLSPRDGPALFARVISICSHVRSQLPLDALCTNGVLLQPSRP
jgi:hypothetical protein